MGVLHNFEQTSRMKQYFVFIKNKKEGPYSTSELQKLNINSNTLIWTKGMDEWIKASDLDELKIVLENIPPPLPDNSKNGFYLHLKNNYKYIFLTLILSFIAMYFIDKNFFSFMVRENYGGYDSANYIANRAGIDNEIRGLLDTLMVLVLLIGLFLVPFLYVFKKKKK